MDTGYKNQVAIANGRLKQFGEKAAHDALVAQNEQDLKRARATNSMYEEVEALDDQRKLETEGKRIDNQNKMIDQYAKLAQSPGMLFKLQAMGLLDEFNRDTGLSLVVPPRKSKQEVLAAIPTLGDLSTMSYESLLSAAEALSYSTGWDPTELVGLLQEIGGAPGGSGGAGGRTTGVSESTVRRS